MRSIQEGPLFWGTLFYYYSACLMGQIAGLLGNREYERQFSELSLRIRNTFNETFFDREEAIYKVEKHTEYRQSANAVPLFLGLFLRDTKTV